MPERRPNLDRVAQVRAGATPESLAEIVTVLIDDFGCLAEKVQNFVSAGALAREDATHARSLIRALFAMVEGSTHALKVKALEHHEALHSTVPPGAMEVVFEERYEVDSTGRIVTRPMKITWEQNVKFTFRFFSEVYSIPNPLRTDADWWHALKRCDKVRDYLMHPRTAHDLNIKPEIIHDVIVAERGFGSALEALIDGMEEVRARTSGGQQAGSDS